MHPVHDILHVATSEAPSRVESLDSALGQLTIARILLVNGNLARLFLDLGHQCRDDIVHVISGFERPLNYFELGSFVVCGHLHLL